MYTVLGSWAPYTWLVQLFKQESAPWGKLYSSSFVQESKGTDIFGDQ
jgi:hypothetical protein